VSAGLVLDTHVLVWLVEDDARLSRAGATRIEAAARLGELYVPAICVWELGLLESKGRISFAIGVDEWVARALVLPGVRLAPLTPDVALEASRLPGRFHGDPVDRIIVASARRLDAALVTADRRIRTYGASGHIAVVAT